MQTGKNSHGAKVTFVIRCSNLMVLNIQFSNKLEQGSALAYALDHGQTCPSLCLQGSHNHEASIGSGMSTPQASTGSTQNAQQVPSKLCSNKCMHCCIAVISPHSSSIDAHAKCNCGHHYADSPLRPFSLHSCTRHAVLSCVVAADIKVQVAQMLREPVTRCPALCTRWEC